MPSDPASAISDAKHHWELVAEKFSKVDLKNKPSEVDKFNRPVAGRGKYYVEDDLGIRTAVVPLEDFAKTYEIETHADKKTYEAHIDSLREGISGFGTKEISITHDSAIDVMHEGIRTANNWPLLMKILLPEESRTMADALLYYRSEYTLNNDDSYYVSMMSREKDTDYSECGSLENKIKLLIPDEHVVMKNESDSGETITYCRPPGILGGSTFNK